MRQQPAQQQLTESQRAPQHKSAVRFDSAFNPFDEDLDPFGENLLLSDFENATSETEEEVLGAPTNVFCATCGSEIKREDAYPRNNSEWGPGNNDGELRCLKCWEKQIREDFIPGMQQSQNALKKQKKKQSKPCKCGAWSHRTSRSKLCPLNKKYNRAELDKEAARKMVVEGAKRRRVAAAAAAAIRRRDTAATKDRTPAADAKDRTPVAAKDCTPVAAKDCTPAHVSDDISGPITPSVPVTQVYEIGDNVTCKWAARQWFLAHITGFSDGKYSVYFLCSKTKQIVPPSDIRPSDTRYPRRNALIGKDFWFDGDHDLPEGRWRVRQLRSEVNLYRCTRLTGDGSKNVEDFDIGYVIKQYMKGLDERREAGVGEVLTTRRRTRLGGNR